MTRILQMIETSGPGGAENMLINHALQMRKAGIESDVLLLKDGWLRQKLNSLSIETFILPLKRFFSPEWIAQAKTLIADKGYTAIHGHEFAMNCHAALLGSICRLPSVATIHGKNYYGAKLQRRLLYRLCAKRSHFVAVSDDIRHFLAREIGVSNERIQVIPNGIDIAKFSSSHEKRDQVRISLNIGRDETLIGAVGNLYPVKGHIHLVHAAKIILEQREDVHFFIAGRGGEQEGLAKAIETLGIKERFHLLGFREDIDALLQAMDIFAMPSLSEGLPLSILEAMSAGKPIVASDIGGIPEVIKHGVSGLLSPPADSTQLASNLLSLIQQPSLRQMLTQEARAIVEEKYNQEQNSRSYIALYRGR